jgi:hypothetical protein
VFPAAFNGRGFSLFGAMAGFEGSVTVYNSINFTIEMDSHLRIDDPNFTAATTRLNSLVCPSDTNSSDAVYGPTNYAGNSGARFINHWGKDAGNGAFSFGSS